MQIFTHSGDPSRQGQTRREAGTQSRGSGHNPDGRAAEGRPTQAFRGTWVSRKGTTMRREVRATVRAGLVGGFVLSLLVLTPGLAVSQQLPIPQLSLWEAQMLSYGQTHCAALATSNISLLDSVYYDADRVFYQIGDYTGNPSWTTCAH